MLTEMVASDEICKKSLPSCRLVRPEDHCHLVGGREDIWQWAFLCVDSYSPGKHEYIHPILLVCISKCSGFKSKYCHHRDVAAPPNLTQAAVVRPQHQIWLISTEQEGSAKRFSICLSTHINSLIHWEVNFTRAEYVQMFWKPDVT